MGEVELEEVLGWKDSGLAISEERQRLSAKMDEEIQHFMQKYAWAFPLGKPVGKLSAYFALYGGEF